MSRRHEQTFEAEQIYRQVVEYDRRGDVYNAVKLCKRLARLAPDWSAPFAYLSWVYKLRREWKPAYHYCLRAVEINPFDERTWETLAIAATALAEWETARQAWNQLGYEFKKSDEALHLDLGLVPVCLNPASRPEIIEAHRIDPVRASIESIPQPSSDRRYKDLILIDSKAESHFFQHGKRLPVHHELQLLKQSTWRTYAVLLETDTTHDVQTLAQLCEEASLGFDNWSNASRFLGPGLHPKVTEYFDYTIFDNLERDSFLVALAARQEKEIIAVLKSWEVISLKNFYGLECLL
ncbi:MAG: hypothetical protein H6577_08295 [Lewinellaceae bacterium]|nr:hypothetical protein [Saprospiraceae bacterium]MCB9338116.1 hypothetical protein [Lewinellaceae bacterium]